MPADVPPLPPTALTPALTPPGDPPRITDGLVEETVRRTGRAPFAVAAAPGRVNLIGEHLDYNGGRCLPLALPHSTFAAVVPREDRSLVVTSLQVGETKTVGLDGLGPGGAPGWVAYVAGVVWALEQDGWSLPGLDVVVDSTVPIGAGLSSSAAIECAVATAVLPVLGVEDTPALRRSLVEACVRAERDMAGAPTGGMDQSVSLLAEEGHALLLDFQDGSSRQVPWTPADDGLALLVVDTRVSHELTDGGYAARRADCEEAASQLGVATLREVAGQQDVLNRLDDDRIVRRARHVLTEMERVDDAVALLSRGEHASLGPLLDASHASLRDDFEVSCAELDVAVGTCRDHGALGARMTGGGFGGSAVALLPEETIGEVTAAVAAAFKARGWRTPAFLLAPASRGAHLLR